MPRPPRFACAAVPLFPLAARLRSEPDLRAESVAIFEGNGTSAHVIAATRSARQAGIQPGMTLPQARALVPKLIARGRDRQSEQAAQDALLDVAETFSPRIEETDQGVVTLDVDGLERRFAGEFRERDLGQALSAAVGRTGLPARVGIACSKLAARVASA
ncbi:MAG: hypothetical protein ABIQ65_13210, partial [Thermoanaerobaculia bacterium]